MKATFDSQCPACLNYIYVGDEIESRMLQGTEEIEWLHRSCNEAEEGPLPTFEGTTD